MSYMISCYLDAGVSTIYIVNNIDPGVTAENIYFDNDYKQYFGMLESIMVNYQNSFYLSNYIVANTNKKIAHIKFYKDEKKNKEFSIKAYPNINFHNFTQLSKEKFQDEKYIDSLFHYVLF